MSASAISVPSGWFRDSSPLRFSISTMTFPPAGRILFSTISRPEAPMTGPKRRPAYCLSSSRVRMRAENSSADIPLSSSSLHKTNSRCGSSFSTLTEMLPSSRTALSDTDLTYSSAMLSACANLRMSAFRVFMNEGFIFENRGKTSLRIRLRLYLLSELVLSSRQGRPCSDIHFRMSERLVPSRGRSTPSRPPMPRTPRIPVPLSRFRIRVSALSSAL